MGISSSSCCEDDELQEVTIPNSYVEFDGFELLIKGYIRLYLETPNKMLIPQTLHNICKQFAMCYDINSNILNTFYQLFMFISS